MESSVPDNEFRFFSGGLLHRILCMVGLAHPGAAVVKSRVAFLILLTYVPLVGLSMYQGIAYGDQLHVPFLYDISEFCRFLIVGPLLIIAEVLVEPWLVQGVQYIREKLVPEDQMDQFENIIQRAVRLRDSVPIELVLLGLVFIWQWSDVYAQSLSVANTWHQLPSNHENSLAYYYYYYFAKPLIRFLWMRWLWRYVIWSLLLCRLPALHLKLMPSHPDRHAGLLFIAKCHQRFVVLAFVFGAQVAGIFAERILHGGKTLFGLKNEMIGVVAVVQIIFMTPLLAFTGKLMNANRQGFFEYSELAGEYTTALKKKWIESKKQGDEILGTQDIQSLADIGNSFNVIAEMRTCLISKQLVFAFALAPLIPMLPLLLTVYPFDELVNHLLKAIM
jgi:hypothetical protein